LVFGTLFLGLYICYYAIHYKYDKNVVRNYDENYDVVVGGNRKYKIEYATINGYKLCNKHDQYHGGYFAYAIVAKIERVSDFVEMCVVDKKICHSVDVLQKSFVVGNVLNISYCETCHEKCKTVEQTSIDAKLAFEQLKIKNFGNHLIYVFLVAYCVVKYLFAFEEDLVKRLEEEYEEELRLNEIEMRPIPVADSV
jgi:hypothetical protein